MKLLTTKQRFFVILSFCILALSMFYLYAKTTNNPIFWIIGMSFVFGIVFNLVTFITIENFESFYDFMSKNLHGKKSTSPKETSWSR